MPSTWENLRRVIARLVVLIIAMCLIGGLLPICAQCKKIRGDRGYWQQVEIYVHDHTDARFTHGICPECAALLFPGVKLSSASLAGERNAAP